MFLKLRRLPTFSADYPAVEVLINTEAVAMLLPSGDQHARIKLVSGEEFAVEENYSDIEERLLEEQS